jgi:hypothetical protein
MEFDWSPEEAEFRQELRAEMGGVPAHRAALAAARWSG